MYIYREEMLKLIIVETNHAGCGILYWGGGTYITEFGKKA